jgi:hypothetical protein
MSKYTESPSGGERHDSQYPVDAVKPANSGLKNGGFMRFIHPFNHNDVMMSPTTSSDEVRTQEQKIKINKGIGGKIKY